jgi:dihydrofolate reductase
MDPGVAPAADRKEIRMRNVSVFNNVTLDGVMQAPAGKNEDTRGGFERGGWALPYDDAVKGQVAGEGMAKGGDLLFGRRTWQHMFKAWHGRTDNPFTEVLDRSRKYVASRSLKEPLEWENSTLLNGDAADAVAQLKQTPGNDLTILGSGELIRALMRRDLIDQFILLIHPLVLGSGRRLFADDGTAATFRLARSVPTTTGVVIATYDRLA